MSYYKDLSGGGGKHHHGGPWSWSSAPWGFHPPIYQYPTTEIILITDDEKEKAPPASAPVVKGGSFWDREFFGIKAKTLGLVLAGGLGVYLLMGKKFRKNPRRVPILRSEKVYVARPREGTFEEELRFSSYGPRYPRNKRVKKVSRGKKYWKINPTGLTKKGERMYKHIYRSYKASGESKREAKRLASMTIYSRAKRKKGLVRKK